MMRRILIALAVACSLVLGAGCAMRNDPAQAKWQSMDDRDLGSGADKETLAPAK